MSTKDYIFIKENSESLIKILYSEISHIGSDGDYCLIYTEKKIFRIGGLLNKMEVFLSPEIFFRCHRSFIVNVDKINAMQNGEAIIGSIHIPISIERKDELLHKINYVHNSYKGKIEL